MPHPMVNIAVQAARRAGDMIVQSLQRLDTLATTEKGPNDFTTEVDLKAEKIILETIRKIYPEHAIIAEESGEQPGEDYTWYVDPLDGTTNFMRGFPMFAVSIGIEHKGLMEHAVIYEPVTQDLFTASRGRGCQLNNRRIRVSDRRTLTGALLGMGLSSKQHINNKPLTTMLESFRPEIAGFRRIGSSALCLAFVAAGRLDGFIGHGLHTWDIAAGTLLIKEAGGMVTNIDGSEKFLHTGRLVACTPKLLKPILQRVQPYLNE